MYLLKCCGLMIMIATIFVVSGAVGMLVMSLTGCLYTSSGLFSISFLGLIAGVCAVLNMMFDITHFF